MVNDLIIVESFAKTKTISKWLGDAYTVICSLGHFKDLPAKELGIDTNTWKGKYVVTNRKIAKNIKDKVSVHGTIYIASDPDIEGEAIAYHIMELIKDMKKKCYRIRFNEISKRSILDAIESRCAIDMDVVYAQETRRFIDRLVGYRLSPFLWSRFKDYKLSVGRVQSIALYLCVHAQDLSGDVPMYWIIKTVDSLKLELTLREKDGVIKIHSKEALMKLLETIDITSPFVLNIGEKIVKEKPPPPYTTTSLQQDAYNRFKFGAKRTMKLAQDLYEGGKITYMRTDSVSISEDFKKKIGAYVTKMYGSGLAECRDFKNKISNSQEAHEAIRMIDIEAEVEGMSKDHTKLYEMIWKRTVASQMVCAEYTSIDVRLTYDGVQGCFVGSRSFLTSLGYLVVYDREVVDFKGFKESLAGIKVSKLLCQASYECSPLYNEIGLIKRLEKEGIGRPSTYATILDKLLEKKYATVGKVSENIVVLQDYIKSRAGITAVERKVNVSGGSTDLIIPTDLGRNVIEYMQGSLSFVLDIGFTRELEMEMDNIISGKDTKKDVLNRFYCSYIEPVCS